MKDEFALLEYPDASIETMGSMVPVKLKFSDQGISYRYVKTGKQDQISPSDIEVVNWQRLSGGYGVRIFTSDGSLYRFGGFKEMEQPKLEKFFKNTFDKIMTEKEFSVKGWNYGSVKFKGGSLAFDVSSLTAFEIPITNVCGCIPGKNEVTLEFHQHDDSAVSLNEMRFHIPASELAGDDPMENFQKKVMAKASVITATGDALAIFQQVHCLTPRGRYDMKMYPTFIQLHGKSFDFKLPISAILRLFLLPHFDGRQHFFVVSLDPPIKQGQTRYPYLIILFPNDETELVELPLTEDEIKEKYAGRLDKEMNGPQYEVISRLFKGICQKKIVTPGNFVGYSGSPAISCSYKAAAGYLYPLERGFIYVHKPPVHIRFDELSGINFARSGSTTRSFDFEVECKTGVIHTFSSIEKGEYNKLYDFVTSKKLRIKNKGKMDSSHKDTFSDSDTNEPDYYINRVKAEAREREHDDESEEDSDFNPEAVDVSDAAEEYDSNASSTDESGSEEEAVSHKKEKKHKPKKAKTVSEKPRKRRPKKEKDENKPKRPQSAYFLWLNDNREKIKAKNPGISITEVSKVAGQMWKDVQGDEKADYDKKAAKAKKEYEAAMAEYKASGGAVKKTPEKAKSPKKAAKVVSPSKAGSGAGFKSKEYIEEDSSSTDSDEKPLKKFKKESKGEKEKPKKEESEEEEKSEEETDESEEESVDESE